ncbi:hypothetical protein G9A89_002484 [Geosiphon pyriformis]|nr:hypothetical protein G9A89_002484 [Geosiphon pyriformis]
MYENILTNETQPTSQISGTLSHDEIRDRIKGCLFGAAIGDAVGLAAEFMSKKVARKNYGKGPIQFGLDTEGTPIPRDYWRSAWDPNDFTDDTDQQLLIIQSLLSTSGQLSYHDFATRLKAWLSIGLPEIQKPCVGSGNTILSTTAHTDFLKDPHSAAEYIWQKSGQKMAANGAVMRTAVLGCLQFWDEQVVRQNAIDVAKVTHRDPRCLMSCVIVCLTVSFLMRGIGRIPDLRDRGQNDGGGRNVSVEIDLEDPTQPAATSTFITSSPTSINDISMDMFGPDLELTNLIGEIISRHSDIVTSTLINDPLVDDPMAELNRHCFPETLSKLWLDESKKVGYTYKSLGAGVYPITRNLVNGLSFFPEGQRTYGNLFKRMITEVTLEGGDADSNATVTGALLGCRLGKSQLPREWVQGVKHHEWLDEMAEKFCELVIRDLNAGFSNFNEKEKRNGDYDYDDDGGIGIDID